MLWELGRAGRGGSRPAAAFVSLFVAANVSGLLVVAAFTSTPWGYDRLHDRYGFYLVPLWLVGFVVWLASGLPRPRVAAAIGAVATLALALILPFAQLANEAGIDTVPGALWVRIEAELAGPGPASGGLALALFVVGLLAATFLLPRGIARLALPAAVAVRFVAMSYFAWQRIVDAPEDLVFAGGLDRAWIDDRVATDASVTKLYVDTSCGSALEGTRSSSRSSSTRRSIGLLTSRARSRTGFHRRVDVSSSGALELRPAIHSGRSTSSRSGRRARRPARRDGNGGRPRALAGRRPRARRRRDIECELRKAVCPTG